MLLFFHEFRNISPFITNLLLIRRPLVLGQGRQACGDICPLPVSLPQRAQNPPVCAVPQLPRSSLDGRRASLLSFESLSPFKAASGTIWVRFGMDFGLILVPKSVPNCTSNRHTNEK